MHKEKTWWLAALYKIPFLASSQVKCRDGVAAPSPRPAPEPEPSGVYVRSTTANAALPLCGRDMVSPRSADIPVLYEPMYLSCATAWPSYTYTDASTTNRCLAALMLLQDHRDKSSLPKQCNLHCQIRQEIN